MYSELQLRRILETASVLERRIGERFQGSGLAKVGAEFVQLTRDTEVVIERLRRPMWALRVSAWTGIAVVFGVMLAMTVLGSHMSPRVEGLVDLLQSVESALNEIIIVGLAVFFLLSVETRAKRRAALGSLHRLRSVVHIVDMHQLTKDPDQVLSPRRTTASSPERHLSRFELVRYLDYCSELLSLASKVAALHVQYLNDAVVLSAVNDIETLASSLSNKIWQKIVILDTALPQEASAVVARQPGASSPTADP